MELDILCKIFKKILSDKIYIEFDNTNIEFQTDLKINNVKFRNRDILLYRLNTEILKLKGLSFRREI